jgi:putative colanic acid biosynthesis glycosyltransferase WcaI
VKILILNQAFYPDVVSTAQHSSDLAVKLTEHGHQVTVIASSRGYDDPRLRFLKREIWKGVRIVRVRTLALGKKTRPQRMLNFASFIISCSSRLLRLRRFDVVVALSSPPLISVVAALLVAAQRARLVYWVMDLNPDEAVSAGWLKQGSLAERFLSNLSHFSLRRARVILALDRFMKERIVRKGIPAGKITVVPPWSHDDVIQYDSQGRRAFRAKHGLTDRFVVMYSGNHSPCHPLDTLLESARRLIHHRHIVFCFVGGGSEFEKVVQFKRRHNLRNVMCFPYQPLNRVSSSLSAADLHVVTMGDPFVGIVHPCKIYNIMHLGIPTLYIGPATSHIIDLLAQLPPSSKSYVDRHGDVDSVVRHILAASEVGELAQPAPKFTGQFSKEALCTHLAQVLELAASDLARPVQDECYQSCDS